MKFDDYQAQAISLAIYPQAYRITYPALGLAGETGEVCEKIKKLHRDDGSVLTEERRELLKKELGDVLWYLSALAHDLGLSLADIAQHNLDKLFSRHERGVLGGSGDTR